MKYIFLIFFCFQLSVSIADDWYHYSIDLKKISNDKVKIILVPPDLKEDEVLFRFPAMVPGTYEVYDFGRFITNFTVLGKDGAVLKVSKLDVNTYKISPAQKIASISYEADDTFDKSNLPGTEEKVVFEPGGTNIEADNNFCINNHSIFGYFKGYSSNPFVLEFQKPKGFYPTTGFV